MHAWLFLLTLCFWCFNHFYCIYVKIILLIPWLLVLFRSFMQCILLNSAQVDEAHGRRRKCWSTFCLTAAETSDERYSWNLLNWVWHEGCEEKTIVTAFSDNWYLKKYKKLRKADPKTSGLNCVELHTTYYQSVKSFTTLFSLLEINFCLSLVWTSSWNRGLLRSVKQENTISGSAFGPYATESRKNIQEKDCHMLCYILKARL